MFKNYITIALRNLLRHTLYSAINIFGLAVGMACCMLMLLYVQYELRYDQHHTNSDRIFRVVQEDIRETHSNFKRKIPGTGLLALKDAFPEVEYVSRVNASRRTWMYSEKQGLRQRFCRADPDFLNMFTLPIIRGSFQTLLHNPSSVLITESAAHKFFGDVDPIGRELKISNAPFASGFRMLVVAGVLKDVPKQSTIQFDVLFATEESARDFPKTGGSNYVMLADGANARQLEQKLPRWLQQHMGNEAASRIAHHLQPLRRVYLYGLSDYSAETSHMSQVYLLTALAGLILLIACVNFMNLTTARSVNRAKEVGMRKVVGANRLKLVQQFLGESTFLAFIALTIAIGIAKLSLPHLNAFVEKPLSLTANGVPTMIAEFLALILGVGLLAGSYPAFGLSAFQPVRVLKGQLKSENKGIAFRKGLVVFQFAIAIVMLIGTTVVYLQWQYLQNKSWGFNTDQVVIIRLNDVRSLPREKWLEGYPKRITVKQTFIDHPNVLAGTFSHNALPFGAHAQVRLEHETAPRHLVYIVADKDFLNTYEIDLIAGRNISHDPAQDFGLHPDIPGEIVLNETAVKHFGWSDPIGRQLVWTDRGNKVLVVIGVMRDFQNGDIHQKLEPMFLVRNGQPALTMSYRVRAERIPETIAHLKKTWKEFVPDIPFEFQFVDARVENMYREDTKFGQLCGIFAMLAIFVACLGLFGLSTFTTEQRIKEIGIRKALGASASNIVILLSKDFVKPVLIANFIAWPIAYYAMENWLTDFAHRIELDIYIFLWCGIMALLIALTSIASQAWKTARSNPVDALRYE